MNTVVWTYSINLVLRILLIGYLYGTTSERKLVEELRIHAGGYQSVELCRSRAGVGRKGVLRVKMK